MEPNCDEEDSFQIFFLLTNSNTDILVHIMVQMGFQLRHWH